MHYWNRTNFEGLRSIASSLAERPELADFAAYCDLRHRGLRQQAMDRLGDPQVALETAAEAEKLLAGFRDPSARDDAREEIEQAKQKVLDWVEFKAARTDQSFQAWCASTRGYTWSTPSRVHSYGRR